MTTGGVTECLRIVAIDDDPADAAILKDLLRRLDDWDIDFRHYTDSIAALVDLVSDPPDAVFMDHRLGAKSGLEIQESLRAEGVLTPIIFLTGNGDESLAVEALKAGATDYLTKDRISVQVLRRAISNALEKHALRTALRQHREDIQKKHDTLVRRNEEVQKFYQTLSHELKTPLTAAREFVLITLEGIAGPINDEQRKFLRIAVESCDQMILHVNDLLDVTRMETGKFKVDRRAIQLGPVVESSVAALMPFAKEKKVLLEAEAAPVTPDACADARRIGQVLENLIRNAVKFTPEGGRVTVGLAERESDGAIQITVRDTGKGMTEEDARRAFDRLFQVGTDEGDRGGGIGLGLYLCQQIVNLHDGEITLDTEPGKGTCLTVILPRYLPMRSLPLHKEQLAHEA
ncbi:MAG: response regulator [Gemmatimonadetes bacterium]|nr:response regulator [Gemmatimonadota bacterium]